MKAFVLRSYGSAEHLELTDVDTPVPAANEVLVRVRATSVNPYDSVSYTHLTLPTILLV